MDDCPLLRVRQFSLCLGKENRLILEDISFNLETGASLGICGHSGAGKTMLARAITGVLPAHARSGGQIELNGDDTIAAPRIGRGGAVLLLQQSRSALDPLRRAGDQIRSVMAAHRTSRDDSAPSAGDLMRSVGLTPDQASAYPHQLSGGQCQRLQIALGLATRPALLICDEPTAALDASAAQAIINLLVGLPHRGDLGLILISHDQRAIMACDQTICIDQGRSGTLSNSGPASPRATLPPGNAAPVLQCRDIRISMDGIEIVRGLDLDLHRGRTLAVVGPSGCGKTTLARGLLGLIPLQSGNIALNGKSWLKLLAREPKTARHRVQIVFQDPNTALNPRQTVGAVIRESIRHRGDPCDLNLITERLAQVELSPDLIPRYPHELSGGQRQRVALARVLAQRPDVLICDEPVSSLDAQLQWKLLELLQRLCRDEDLALLLISHDPEQVRHFADAVLSMADGKAIEANLDAGAASASIAPKG